ncbi:MAG: Hpt domain-containing protein, partial [Planctomycetes bacterium]|nr:Hpt domain-containing protein [Planctomycetota bacterium]
MSESQLNTNDDLLDEVLPDFLDESDQLLTQLNENLLQLDEWVQSLDENHQQRCDEDLMNEMFRAAHSLKGLSAMLGLTDINNLTHKIENVFDAARTDKLIITGDVTELLFMGLDQLVALVDLLKEPDGEPVECGAVLDSIQQVLQSAGAERKQGSQADVESFIGSGAGEGGEESLSGSSADASTSGTESAADPFEGLQDEKEIPDKYLSIFIDESEDSLDRLTSALLALESGGEGDELKSLMSTAHKIKGSAASIGLNRVAKLAHLMEDLLEKLVQTGGRLSAETADVLHKCTDGLGQYVTDLKGGAGGSDHFGQLARELLAAQSGDSPADVDSVDGHSPGTFHETPPADESLSERLESVLAEIRGRLESADIQAVTSATGIAAGTIQRVREGESEELESLRALAAYFDGTADSASGRTTYVGEVKFQSDLPTAGMKAELIYEKLSRLGDVCDCQPTPEQLGEIDYLDYFRFRVTSDQSLEAVIRQARVAGVQEVSVKPLDGSPAKPQCVSESPETQATLAAPQSDTAQLAARTGPDKDGQPESKPVAAEAEDSTAKPERTLAAMKSDVDKGPGS